MNLLLVVDTGFKDMVAEIGQKVAPRAGRSGLNVKRLPPGLRIPGDATALSQEVIGKIIPVVSGKAIKRDCVAPIDQMRSGPGFDQRSSCHRKLGMVLFHRKGVHKVPKEIS